MTDAAATQRTPHEKAALLFLHAQTGLHPGSGTALGVVDLPVQRERHTHWPLIPGSALKGVLRDRCREVARHNYTHDPETSERPRSQRQKANEDDLNLTTVFGPGKIGDEGAHAGAVSVTDARILAFPVRSLKGVFAWVTCPAVLGRLQRDLSLTGCNGAQPFAIPNIPQTERAACLLNGPLLVDGNKLVLEEFEFERVADATAAAQWIARHAVSSADSFTSERLKQHLVVLHDDDFTHFVRHATEVMARIALDYDKKTVSGGALFYQEFLPPETIMYALLFASASRAGRNGKAGIASAAEILGYVRKNVPDGSILQIGGDETTGKGLCAVRIDGVTARGG
jgi:CRISPR-associated protein Cmr4